MLNMKNGAKKALMWSMAAGTIFSFSTGALAKEAKPAPSSYQTITEIKDWGAVNTKVMINLGKKVPVHAVSSDTFSVHVKRSDPRLAEPFLEEGFRTVTHAFVSDKHGNPSQKPSQYVVLEMKIGPALSLGSALNYDWQTTSWNDWTKNEYTITQNKPIDVKGRKDLENIVINQFAGETRELVDEFETGKMTHDNVTLSYADYTPQKDSEQNPLIIWLHGGGEGGTDATIPLSANKAVNFASDDIQSHFGGAYVLAPQAPTYWMDGLTGRADGTSKYEDALMALIQEHVAANPDIDPNRIYLGGASNGGYMSLLLTRDYPDFFAASFPVAEGLNDVLVTDADIEKLKQTPTWFVTAANDAILPPEKNTIPTYERLVAAGGENIHLTLFKDVHDTSGLYQNENGAPYQYNGHWSWIYVFNNEVETTIDGTSVTLMEWLADQSLQP